MNSLNKVVRYCLLVVAGCATADDTAASDDIASGDVSAGDVSPDDGSPGDVASDEGSVSQGEITQIPGGPLIESAGNSSATIISSSAISIQGGSEQGSYLLASYSTTPSGSEATARFTVKPRGAAAFVYTLRGTGSGYSSRQLRLERTPGSGTLDAASSQGIVHCGPIVPDAPNAVTLVFHGATQTFDVLLGGAATPCAHLSTKMKAPVVGFRLMDASNVGYGGNVEFSNLAVQ